MRVAEVDRNRSVPNPPGALDHCLNVPTARPEDTAPTSGRSYVGRGWRAVLGIKLSKTAARHRRPPFGAIAFSSMRQPLIGDQRTVPSWYGSLRYNS